MENLPQKKEKLLLEAILEKSSKIELIKVYSNLSIEKIVSNKMPSIGGLKKAYGAEKIETAVGVLFQDLNSSFSNELSNDQLLELVAEVTNGFNLNISFEGIYLTCREIKYNNTHGKITVNKVLKAISEHMDKMMNFSMQMNLNKHLSIKESPNEERTSSIDKVAHRIAKRMHLEGKLK